MRGERKKEVTNDSFLPFGRLLKQYRSLQIFLCASPESFPLPTLGKQRKKVAFPVNSCFKW